MRHLIHAYLDASLFAEFLQLPPQLIIRSRHEMGKGQQLQLALLSQGRRCFGQQNTSEAG